MLMNVAHAVRSVIILRKLDSQWFTIFPALAPTLRIRNDAWRRNAESEQRDYAMACKVMREENSHIRNCTRLRQG